MIYGQGAPGSAYRDRMAEGISQIDFGAPLRAVGDELDKRNARKLALEDEARRRQEIRDEANRQAWEAEDAAADKEYEERAALGPKAAQAAEQLRAQRKAANDAKRPGPWVAEKVTTSPKPAPFDYANEDLAGLLDAPTTPAAPAQAPRPALTAATPALPAPSTGPAPLSAPSVTLSPMEVIAAAQQDAKDNARRREKMIDAEFAVPSTSAPSTEDVHLGGGMYQKYQYNPKTLKFDIPVGQPFKKDPAKTEGEDPEKAKQRNFDNAAKLRDKYDAHSAKYIEVRDNYKKMQAAAENPTGASDITLVFMYMKTIDPDSAVKEGEFATASNSAGVPAALRNRYNNIVSGERLTPEQRSDLISEGRKQVESQKKAQMRLQSRYMKLAKTYGIDPAEVVEDYTADDEPGTPKRSKAGNEEFD